MSEPKPHYKPNSNGLANGRAQFTLPDMLRALRGFRSPEGFTVMPNDIADRVLEEIERLYGVEDTLAEMADAAGDLVGLLTREWCMTKKHDSAKNRLHRMIVDVNPSFDVWAVGDDDEQ